MREFLRGRQRRPHHFTDLLTPANDTCVAAKAAQELGPRGRGNELKAIGPCRHLCLNTICYPFHRSSTRTLTETA